jgi:rhodanese-related sulfurtransferase
MDAPLRVESLGGAFHPHAIEVQDFSYYALIIDVRSPHEYEHDHIPGAVQFTPAVGSQGPLVTGRRCRRPSCTDLFFRLRKRRILPIMSMVITPCPLLQKMRQSRVFTWLSFGSALSAKVAQSSVGANIFRPPCG